MDKVLVYLSILHRGNWDKIYEDILNKKNVDKNDMEKVLSANKEKFISLLDPNYPIILKQIFKPPFVLFYRGDLTLLTDSLTKKIAVVGSRDNSEYGKTSTEKICKNLINNSATIISGLAKGIDSIAHKCCLENGGKTIAVLGCGIDYIYPKENKDLYEEISKKGLLISEYPLGTGPDKTHFPARNRIISGLCDALVVTEAKTKSGTMNTVYHALEDGKPIFCVPDKINCDSGCNKLIKEGAHLIEDGFEVLEEIS